MPVVAVPALVEVAGVVVGVVAELAAPSWDSAEVPICESVSLRVLMIHPQTRMSIPPPRPARARKSASRSIGGSSGIGNDKLRRARAAEPEPLFCPAKDWSRSVNCRPLSAVFSPACSSALLKLRLLTLQERERIGAVGGHMRRHLAVAVDVELHVDAAELGRIEADVELVGAGLRPRRDRDRKASDRHGGRRR